MVYLVLVVGAVDNVDNCHLRRSGGVAKSCGLVDEGAGCCGYNAANCGPSVRHAPLSPIFVSLPPRLSTGLSPSCAGP